MCPTPPRCPPGLCFLGGHAVTIVTRQRCHSPGQWSSYRRRPLLDLRSTDQPTQTLRTGSSGLLLQCFQLLPFQIIQPECSAPTFLHLSSLSETANKKAATLVSPMVARQGKKGCRWLPGSTY